MLDLIDERAVEAGQEWLRRHAERALVIPHGDADGLAAAAVLVRLTGGTVLHVETPWKGALPRDRPLVVADWGVRRLDEPSDLLYVDHHADPEPVEAVVVHASGRSVTTSLLAWQLADTREELAWLAALGAVGDLGAGALGRGGIPSAGSVWTLRRLAALVSAPGRLRDGPLDHAFAVLADSSDPRRALDHAAVARLEQARSEVDAYRRAAMRTRPEVGEGAALIRLNLPARVHSQVASAWTRRLAPRIVVVANSCWKAGLISFVVRSAAPLDLRAWLRALYTPPPGSGDYGRGHAGATGGSLTPEAFEAFARHVLTAPEAAG
jgi:hypothetical protein